LSLAAGGNGAQAWLKMRELPAMSVDSATRVPRPWHSWRTWGRSIGRDGRARGDVGAKIAGLGRVFSENRSTEQQRVVCTPDQPIGDAPGRARAAISAIADENLGCHAELPSMEIDRAS
jgi:hypothetical protein